MVYRLRGHHLICLQFYKGEGYGEDFVKNLNRMVEAWEFEPVEVVNSVDDICQKCPHLKETQCTYFSNEIIEEDDKLALKLLGIKPGARIEKKFVKEKIPEIIEIWKKETCQDCDWRKVCHLP